MDANAFVLDYWRKLLPAISADIGLATLAPPGGGPFAKLLKAISRVVFASCVGGGAYGAQASDIGLARCQ